MLTNKLLTLSPYLSGIKKPKIWNYQLSNLGYFPISFSSCYCYFQRCTWDSLHTDKSITRH